MIRIKQEKGELEITMILERVLHIYATSPNYFGNKSILIKMIFAVLVNQPGSRAKHHVSTSRTVELPVGILGVELPTYCTKVN